MLDNGHRDLHKATQPHSRTLPFFKNKQHFKNKIFMQDISKMRIFAQDKLRLGNMEQVSLCPALIASAKYKFTGIHARTARGASVITILQTNNYFNYGIFN